MNTKILGFFIIFSIFLILPNADAQLSIGEKVQQELVEIMIDSEGIVKIKHVTDPSNVPSQMDFIKGTVLDISVMSETGTKLQPNIVGENTGLLILPSSEKTIVEYALKDVLFQKNGLWKWDFRYLETTNFIIPEEVNLLFVNERPLYLQEDERGFRCHGCNVVLEYSIDEPKYFEEVTWEDKTFVVEVRTLTEINNFTFSQPEKKLSFSVPEDDQFITIVIPLDLLWEPYVVLVDNEQIVHYQFFEDGTHAWLNLRPDSAGEISIIGTTVVPEFPFVTPLALGLIVVLVVPLVRKINLH